MEETHDAKRLLSNSGLRSTKARIQILKYLIEHPTHPNVEELKQALNQSGDSIPTATLYQSLEKLTAANLLLKFPGTDGQLRYDANLKYHHHLICTCCNKVVDVHLRIPLSKLAVTQENGSEAMEGWELRNERIELKGICPACREQQQDRKSEGYMG